MARIEVNAPLPDWLGESPPLQAYADDYQSSDANVYWKPAERATTNARHTGGTKSRVDGKGGLAAPGGEPRYTLTTTRELAARAYAPYRIKGVLLRDAVAAIYGPSTAGKTFLALDMAFHLADGKEFFGHRTKACDVLYIALEGEAGLAQRVKALREQHGEDAGERVRFLTAPLSLLYPDDVDALIEAVRKAKIRDGVIFIDTLNAATPGGDENSSIDMGLAIASVKRIREECGGAVVLIHHCGKDALRGLRGHSSLFAALDTVIEVTRDGDRRELRLNKFKDGEDGESHSFRLDILEVGKDEDGDRVTSCVVAPTEATGESVRRVLPPKSGNQRIVWDALGEVFRASTDFGRAGAPPGRPCLQLDTAIDAVRGRVPVEPKRQTERTRVAVTGLIGRGLIGHNEGWIWCK